MHAEVVRTMSGHSDTKRDGNRLFHALERSFPDVLDATVLRLVVIQYAEDNLDLQIEGSTVLN